MDAAVTGARRSGLGYLPGLDGLRAVSVALVFLFHARVIDGGFIGVDVFFVISGFLITGLAIDEIERTGRLGLAAFWARRARRLLPALFLLCAGVVGWSLIDRPVPGALGREVVSTLLYVANWSRVGNGDEYFAAYERPSLLEHTWSLAVEEQFYVVWPLVLVAAVWIARRLNWSPRHTIGAIAGATAVVSTAWAWLLARGDDAPLNRLYFGTDTRAVGLAIGCLAACALTRGRETSTRRVTTPEVGAAVVATVVLGVLSVQLNGTDQWLYGPGFAVVALASIVLVVAASGTGPVAQVLGVRPLAQVGRVSYGIYLWHWPVIVVLDAQRTGLSGIALGALWVAATAVLTTASWLLVERRAPLPTAQVPARAIAYAAVCGALCVAAVSVVRLDTDRGSRELALPPTAPPEPVAEGPASDGASNDPGDRVVATTVAPPSTLAAPADRPLRVLLLGDSVAESLKAAPASLTSVEGIDVRVENRSVVACPVMYEGRWVFDDGRIIDDPPDCDFPERFADTVAASDPDLIVMMFAWGGTIAGRELADGSVAAPCDAPFDAAFGDALVRLVDRFDDTARVIVTNTTRPTEFRNAEQSDRPGCLNAAIEQTALDVFDFNNWLCPDDDCTAALPLMRDTVHFADSDDVRALVWPDLMSQFLATAGYIEST